MLEKLRAKPNHVKQWISLFFTVLVFSVILFVWWSSRGARSQEIEVREKTVSPVGGVVSMFSGIASGVKEKISGIPTFQQTKESTTFPTSTKSDDFDISGLVIIDSSLNATTSTSTDSEF